MKVDQDLCIGAAMCEVAAGNTFEVGDDGVSHVIGIGDAEAALFEAKDGCPSGAIEVLRAGEPLE